MVKRVKILNWTFLYVYEEYKVDDQFLLYAIMKGDSLDVDLLSPFAVICDTIFKTHVPFL